MATNGNLLTNGWYSSSKGDYIYLEFAWSVTYTSIAENYKDIYWELRGKRTASGYVNAGGFQVVIDGETVYNKSTDYRIELRNGTVVASGTKRLWHNTDGTRSFSVSISGAIYTYAVNCTGSKAFDLDTIPRQATLTAAPNFTDLQNPTISYSNSAGNSVSALDACISFTGAKDDIAYRAISKTGSTYTFNLTDAERDVLRNNTAGRERQVIFYVRTTIGGVPYFSTIERTLSIVESTATRPSVSMSLSLDNSTLPSAFAGLYVQGKSKAKVTLTAQGKYGAGISSYSTSVNGKTYTAAAFTTDAITSAGTVAIASSVKDSRGFTGTANGQITVVPYSIPRITSFSAERQDDGTTVIARLKGGVSPVDNKNSKAFSVTLNGETKTIAASGYEVDGTVTFTNIPTDATLVAQAKVTDAISAPVTKDATVPTVAVTMDFHSSGNGVAFGKVAEHENRLDVAWPVLMRKGFDSVNLTSGQDLNNCKIAGFYRCTQDAIAKTLVNCPTDQAFSLMIEQHAGYKQTLTTYRTDVPTMYIRNCYMDVWGPWYKVTLTKV